MDKNTKNTETLDQVKPKAPKTVLQVIGNALTVGEEAVNCEVMHEPKKLVLNLDETLKIVEDLHQKKRYMERLNNSITQLDNFTIKQEVENLDLKSNFSGCKIEIFDDQRNSWETKNPTIINDVVNYMKNRFSEKLGEIEAQIILPI